MIGTGGILKDVLDAAEQMQSEGIDARVVEMHTIKPVDKEVIIKAVEETGKVITVEDHNINGGLGSAVAEVIAEYGRCIQFRRLGLCSFSNGYGTYMQVKEQNGIGIRMISDEIKRLVD